MKHRILKYLILLTLGLCLMYSCKNYNVIEESPNESNIYNDLFDTLYAKERCQFLMSPPEMLPEKPSEEYVNEYNEKYAKFKKSFYSSNLVIYINDTLTDLNLRSHYDFIIEHLEPQDSLYKKLILDSPIVIKPRSFDIDSLNQEGVNFKHLISVKDFKFGKDSADYNIGIMNLSRICFNKSFDIGICYFFYMGSPSCGFGTYLFIKKENNKWSLHKRIPNIAI